MGEQAIIGWLVKGRDREGRVRQISPIYTVYGSAVVFANLARKGDEYTDVQVQEKVRKDGLT